MKEIKVRLLITLMALCLGTIANAQTDSTQQVAVDTASQDANIPESYMETQEQLQEDGTVGAATNNIDDNNTPADPGAANYEVQEETEELRVYSGRHEGNNYVKTIQVKVPASRTGNSYNNYQPK